MSDFHQTLFLWLNLSPSASAWSLSLARFATVQLPAWVLVFAFSLAAVGQPRWRCMARQMLLAMALAWLLARGIQWALPMPRPYVAGLGHLWLAHAPSPGFPSSHASVAMALGVVGWLSAPHAVGGALLLAVGVLISWSRLALGLHFPVDVLTGALLATVVAWLVVHRWSRGRAWLTGTCAKAPVALPPRLD
ncbi:undecaprenyl-diphosphatase [Hydrogenophaga palleronii]|uniref:Undecaprenyl-diphosphatase n=1 Tax=Hydrogenophaga palleronii TaxID=65655 RepID=A0ABU1WM37_9BURK|nr:phosphatase PAP2 family protein [Hydrogenophaga palleronii]MDR7149987.1 undecaprenyl-diphosphatase [Hydrogenophaga palleronii]